MAFKLHAHLSLKPYRDIHNELIKLYLLCLFYISLFWLLAVPACTLLSPSNLWLFFFLIKWLRMRSPVCLETIWESKVVLLRTAYHVKITKENDGPTKSFWWRYITCICYDRTDWSKCTCRSHSSSKWHICSIIVVV